MTWASFNARELARFSESQFINLNLFDGDAFFGRLICFSRGQNVPVHVHDHKDECFDVVQGQGTLILMGKKHLHRTRALQCRCLGVPGMMLYVPAGVTHGLRADGTERWVVRETVSERVHARRALGLVARAIMK